MPSLAEFAPRTEGERLVVALTLAALVHGVLLFGLRFVDEPKAPPTPTLEVTLSQYAEDNPDRPQFAAPTTQRGSGDERTRTETTSTEVAEFASDRTSPVARQSAATPATPPEAEIRPLTVEARDAPAQPELSRESRSADSMATDNQPYFDAAREVARLQARLAQDDVNRAMGPRIRRITSVSTLATDEAYYLDAWRREVEQVGNLNYPAQARAKRIHGSVRMLVIIRADGTLEEARVLESSGFDVLDRAAVDIVRLAAPFPVFPDGMRRRMDVLEIIRTWQFRPGRRSGDGFSG